MRCSILAFLYLAIVVNLMTSSTTAQSSSGTHADTQSDSQSQAAKGTHSGPSGASGTHADTQSDSKSQAAKGPHSRPSGASGTHATPQSDSKSHSTKPTHSGQSEASGAHVAIDSQVPAHSQTATGAHSGLSGGLGIHPSGESLPGFISGLTENLQSQAAGVVHAVQGEFTEAMEGVSKVMERVGDGKKGLLEMEALVKLLIKKIVFDKGVNLKNIVSGDPVKIIGTFIMRLAKLLKTLGGIAILLDDRSNAGVPINHHA